jgi:hypothetical protein
MAANSCKSCGKYEIRRNFSFRGAGQWREYTDAHGFIELESSQLESRSEYLFFRCGACPQTLKLLVKLPDESDLYTATLAHTEQDIPLPVSPEPRSRPQPVAAPAPAPIDRPNTPLTPMPDRDDALKEEAAFASAFAAWTGIQGEPEVASAVFTLTQRLQTEDIKLRKEMLSENAGEKDVCELWCESGLWILAKTNTKRIEGNRFLYGKHCRFVLGQMESLVPFAYVDYSPSRDWLCLESYVRDHDHESLSVCLPWVKTRVSALKDSFSSDSVEGRDE